MTIAHLICEWLEQNGDSCEFRLTNCASFDLLFCPKILVGASRQAVSVAPNVGPNYWTRCQIGSIVVIVGRPSDGGLRKIDGASGGVDFLRLFSRLDAGQDALRDPHRFR
jgi:hypothetical protein